MCTRIGALAESADAADLKSAGGNTLWVQPPLAPHVFVRRVCRSVQRVAPRIPPVYRPVNPCDRGGAERSGMFFDRMKLEELEDKTLAPYAVRSKDTKGRAYLDTEPAYRTAFQRDRDRIIHTTAFRRLEYKTQVFINYE